MSVYEQASARPWDIAAIQRTGYFRVSYGAGLQCWCDGGYSCQTELREGVIMNDRLFCRRCRILMTAADQRGYAILDLHDPDHIRPYAIIKGQEYEINGYTVNIEPGQAPYSICVKTVGHLLD